ncbi:L,D-transpeptidase [Labrys monachus]|uniref:Lipoprotein-anchoring transpeptidase ErfK/SrfK n=1 Tax=Labrys monachus TaxID=217067 RepID=A0ABU0FLV2_9HYPH|nr:L,D-transpeptidase [Labrys monachus]MDQ0395114.1 lipoprotein-anchoring transpeptidase ErfK/SrfK [Labrys monachus]
MIKKTIFLPILAVIVLGGTARAQELDDGSRYAPFYGQDDGQGYAGQRGARWAPPETDYRYDSGDADPGQYDPGQEDPGYYDPGQDDGAPGNWQGSQPQRRIAPRAEGDAGAKDDTRAVMAVSPIPREIVPFSGYAPGTIIISTRERRLYLMLDDSSAVRYGIGVGKEGFAWKGEEAISRKREWPDWTPPKEMIARRPNLPGHMDGGLNNPLGARALYLGSTLYRIHGTNEPDSIGKAVSSGCIRMANPDIIDLYNRVDVGAHVVVL